MMRRSRSVEDLVSAPVDHWYAGKGFLVWADGQSATGTAAWGHVTATTARELASAWRFEEGLVAPYRSVVDLSALESVDAEAFAIIAAFMQSAMPRLVHRIERQALARPAGMSGALVAGFYPTLQPGFAWRDFSSVEDAYAWCWPNDRRRAATITALVTEARQTTSLAARVRVLLAERLGAPPPLPAVARRLGVATRSLQRALRASGTSFRDELAQLRIEAAKQSLRERDDKIETIARRLGFASLPAFTTLFGRLVGEPPAAYRSRHRR